MVTLLCCEAVFGAVRGNVRIRRVVHATPTVVVAHGQPQQDLMRKTHVTYEDIMSCIRRAGIANLKHVRCIVLEPSGTLSVLGYDIALDPDVLDGVLGGDRVLSGESVDPQ